MSIHLDTNIAIGILNGTHPEYRTRCRERSVAGEELLVSSIVVHELWYGVEKSQRVKMNADALRRLLADLDGILPFTDDHARAAADIRATLEKVGRPIGPYDVLIAGHAVREAATLATANAREFARVPGLKIEDWSK